MTFVCLGIAKLECQISLGISFLSLISPCMIYLKEKSKEKRSKMLLKMIASVYFRRCGSYRMYLEGDSPHQIGSNAIQTSFPRSLSIYPCLFTSQTLYSFSKPLPQEILGLNQVLLHLVSV